MPQKKDPKKPEVVRYLHPTHFLTDYYKYRKGLDERFSYNEWAQELGFKNRSFLRLVVVGKRTITEASLKILLGGLDLDEIGKEYFSHLVWQSLAKSEAERLKHSEILASLLRLYFNRFEVRNHLHFLTSPQIPSLQVLLGYEDLDRSLESLCHMMQAPAEKLQEWLKILEELKMAEADTVNGIKIWKATSQSFRVPDQSSDVAIRHYHARSLEKAVASLDLPTDTRTFRSLLFPLNAEQLAEVQQKINAFAIDLLKQYEGMPFSDRRLYQLNINTIPVSVSAPKS